MSDVIEIEKYKIHGSMEKLRKALAERKETTKFMHITFRDRKGFEKKEYSKRVLTDRVLIPEFQETVLIDESVESLCAGKSLITRDDMSIHEFILWEIEGDRALYIECGSKKVPT